MSERKPEDPTMEPTDAPQEIVLQVQPVGPRATHAVPTMDEAFMTLCQAMAQRLDDADDLPGAMHAEEIMGFYTNGNHAIAWQHAVLLLEKATGVPLRGLT